MSKDLLQKNIIVIQTGSASKLTKKQKSNLIGLGLRGVNTTSNIFCSPSVFGMIKKVEHVVKVSATHSKSSNS